MQSSSCACHLPTLPALLSESNLERERHGESSPSVYRAAPQRTKHTQSLFLATPLLLYPKTRGVLSSNPSSGRMQDAPLQARTAVYGQGAVKGLGGCFWSLCALIWFENQPPPASPAVCPPHDAMAIPRLASGGSTSQPEATCLCSTLPLLKDQ